MRTHPERKTDNLHRGRVSLAHARYWLTCATVNRHTCLLVPAVAKSINDAITVLSDTGDLRLLCCTIMPEHLHVVGELGNRLTVGQVLAKFKSFTRSALKDEGGIWQRDFFEHRLRPHEVVNPYARYTYLNPYRAGIITRAERWPHWRVGDGAAFDFLAMLDSGGFPPEEWINSELEALGVRLEYVGEE